MNKFIFTFSILCFPLYVSSCGMMQRDCMSLVDDRDAYRNCMAVQGNQTAQFELGMAAFEANDYDTAINWFKRAARPKASQEPLYLQPEQNKRRDLSFEEDRRPQLPGHRGAQRMLVRIYQEGIGVDVNEDEVERYRNMINQL